MKVVLFCGGLGTRLREGADTMPKPLVEIGSRPIIWHLMKYYAHYGHKDFILCLGFKGEMIKDYFLNYDPYVSCDVVMRKGGREVERFHQHAFVDGAVTEDAAHDAVVALELDGVGGAGRRD